MSFLIGISVAGEWESADHWMRVGFCDEHALILYVYLPNDEDGPESVLTVSGPGTVFLHSAELMVPVLHQFV